MEDIILKQMNAEELEAMIRRIVRSETQALQTPAKEKDEKLLSAKEVCELLRITKPTLHNWKKSDKIPFHRIGHRIYFKKSEVMNALQSSSRYFNRFSRKGGAK
jgi:excisionase family DNA binding protein